jgi:hypothetical protein
MFPIPMVSRSSMFPTRSRFMLIASRFTIMRRPHIFSAFTDSHAGDCCQCSASQAKGSQSRLSAGQETEVRSDAPASSTILLPLIWTSA